MELEKKVKFLEIAYAGVLADAVRYFDKEGVLETVTDQKRKEQLMMGKTRADSLGIKEAQDVFKKSCEIYNCAKWEIEEEEDGFTAINQSCKLCAMAKQMTNANPCHIYCLNPMEGMVKGVNPDSTYEVLETLWDGKECRVKIKG